MLVAIYFQINTTTILINTPHETILKTDPTINYPYIFMNYFLINKKGHTISTLVFNFAEQ